MAIIRITTEIAAPPVLCFDLARSVDVHLESASGAGERAVAGVTAGLLSLGDEVTWRTRHFRVRQELTSRITAFDPPRHFRDSMVRGAFARFDHDHIFEAIASGTRMIDVFDFAAPWGALGTIVEWTVLTKYMTRFLRQRAQVIKRKAETPD